MRQATEKALYAAGALGFGAGVTYTLQTIMDRDVRADAALLQRRCTRYAALKERYAHVHIVQQQWAAREAAAARQLERYDAYLAAPFWRRVFAKRPPDVDFGELHRPAELV